MIARQDVEEQQALGSKSKQPLLPYPSVRFGARLFVDGMDCGMNGKASWVVYLGVAGGGARLERGLRKHWTRYFWRG